ncbi:hypothetical protein HHI36_003983 [Cryptolaemus montrouzieri]|uniref:Uncharacterized protein n=1 Tax=Cryptolaemus montrouzieri TaxID=559131 RepID=A0ABD2NQ98_9CUCU
MEVDVDPENVALNEEGPLIDEKVSSSSGEECKPIAKLFTSKSPKIAREGTTIDKETSPAQEGHQEWRKFVGSIRRKVQRHASSSGSSQPHGQTERESLSRKNSLTHPPKLGFLKKDSEKSRSQERKSVTKQFSFGSETSPLLCNQSSNVKSKTSSSSSMKVDSLAAPKTVEGGSKGVRKSDKKDSDKIQKSSYNLSRSRSSCSRNKMKEDGKGLKHDDFLKATMRIFLVVSPPAGKMQVISLIFLY